MKPGADVSLRRALCFSTTKFYIEACVATHLTAHIVNAWAPA